DRARPGLMAVALRHPQIDRKVGAAGEHHDVIEREPPAPIRFGQTIDANAPAKSAAVEYSRMISEPRERHLSGHGAGCDRERARMRRLEPKIETGEIAGRHRRACEGGPRCDLAHLP